MDEYLADVPRQREGCGVMCGSRQNAECRIAFIFRAGVECLFCCTPSSQSWVVCGKARIQLWRVKGELRWAYCRSECVFERRVRFVVVCESWFERPTWGLTTKLGSLLVDLDLTRYSPILRSLPRHELSMHWLSWGLVIRRQTTGLLLTVYPVETRLAFANWCTSWKYDESRWSLKAWSSELKCGRNFSTVSATVCADFNLNPSYAAHS